MNRITLITLGVRDLKAARDFYESLGWTSNESTPGVAFFDCGGFKFGLFGLNDLAKEQGRPVESLGRGAMTLAINFASAESVDDAFAAALAAGGTSLSAPGAMHWGGYSAYWADPDGHVWEYAFNPFWPLDSEGRLTGP